MSGTGIMDDIAEEALVPVAESAIAGAGAGTDEFTFTGVDMTVDRGGTSFSACEAC